MLHCFKLIQFIYLNTSFAKLIHVNVVGTNMLAPDFIDVLRYFLHSFASMWEIPTFTYCVTKLLLGVLEFSGCSGKNIFGNTFAASFPFPQLVSLLIIHNLGLSERNSKSHMVLGDVTGEIPGGRIGRKPDTAKRSDCEKSV